MKIKSVTLLLVAAILASMVFFETPAANAQSQYVYNISTVTEGYKFQNTGWNIQNFYVEMPEARASAIIEVSATMYDGDCSRYFQIYVNDVKAYETIVSGSFALSVNILNYLKTGTNKIGLVITTWTWGGRSQYWLVSAHIDVKYSASKHIGSSKSWFAPYYKFRNTGWNVINFKAAVPNGLVSAKIDVSGTSFGDQILRYLKVYVDGQLITPTDYTVASSFSWPSPDITNLLAFKKYVTIGIVLTTYEYTSGAHWRVTGTLSTNSRSEVWQDNDASKWFYTDYAMSAGETSVYDTTSSGGNENRLLGISSFEIKGRDLVPYPVFYVGTMMHIPASVESSYGIPWYAGNHVGLFINHEIRISITYSSGSPIPASWIPESDIHGYASPNSDGTDPASTGADMLRMFGILATAFQQPELGVPLSIASILVKYLPASFTFGRDTNGVIYLNDLRRSTSTLDDSSDLLAFTVNFSGVGDYKISFSDTLTVWSDDYWTWGGGHVWTKITQQTFTYQTTYHYGS